VHATKYVCTEHARNMFVVNHMIRVYYDTDTVVSIIMATATKNSLFIPDLCIVIMEFQAFISYCSLIDPSMAPRQADIGVHAYMPSTK
jgi:TRAP-type mannitol/chloroaromatic compound transport system permease large subunit